MRANAPFRLSAIFLAALLAACSSTPSDDTDGAEQTATTEETTASETAPVASPEPVKPDTSAIPLTADNFHNHPSNYDGSTDTKVIYFAFDQSTVSPAAFETLRAHDRGRGPGDRRGALGERHRIRSAALGASAVPLASSQRVSGGPGWRRHPPPAQGVLFLDELPEFARAALEVLREPLETGRVSIARAAARVDYPAAIQLVAAMNPCPCGRLGEPSGQCRCTPDQVARYRGRLSGPLLDRIDLFVEVPRLAPRELQQAAPGEASAPVRGRVVSARQRQLARDGCPAARLPAGALEQSCRADAEARALLERASERLGLSARAWHRCLRLARTIADLAGEDTIGPVHVAEAVGYRRADPGRGGAAAVSVDAARGR